MGEYAIEAKNLVKLFGKQRAVDGIDLTVPKGIVYGFLGPNGAGKTTTVRMLATLLKPDGGYAKVMGYDVAKETGEVRKQISLTGQYASLDEDLTGIENLVMIGRLFGYSKKLAKERAMELLQAFRLEDAGKKQVKNYSGGMRRRMDIAASIIVTPELLFLDEPTTGLDPMSRNEVWDIIRALVKAGTTVLLTTQYLEEADQLADRIAVIHRGKIIAEATSKELKDSVGDSRLQVELASDQDREEAIKLLEEQLATTIYQTDNQTLTAQVNHPTLVVEALGKLTASGINIVDFSLGKPSLDEVFLTLTGEKVEEEDHG
ncbi:ABC-2 type transport system ATP-binding protein [Alkalihalobacillus xiaoxiensis]|uniref:ABC-2 type transport system ATP-binding protein n=1 Tax=Shouchella xiaoxiensis TaxID=766895 RepID=A0ABS2SP92_9BACI|nr:ATP-binding cassette domain-containing protein [Shouchella xiaoxiensis]MBM7836816.1 ABC-2 type transport system ATP-binding protein [Shouchella xiaoxiensis]